MEVFFLYPVFFQKSIGSYYKQPDEEKLVELKNNFDSDKLCTTILQFFEIIGIHGPFRNLNFLERLEFEEWHGNTSTQIAAAMKYLLKLIFKDDRATGLAKTDDVSKIMPTDQEIKLCGQKLRTILHPLVEFESEELMLAKKMPRCGCTTKCKSARCSCSAANRFCTILCKCDDNGCLNNERLEAVNPQ